MLKSKYYPNILICLCFLFILTPCAVNNIYSQVISDSTFYPLHVGNCWTYEYYSGPLELKISVVGDTIISNKKYFILILNESEYTWARYERIDSIGNTWLYDLKNYDKDTNTTELLMEDFSSSIRTKFKSKRFIESDTAEILNSFTTLSKYTKTTNNVVAIIYYVYHDESINNYFEKGIGMTISSLGIAGEYRLKSAIINGKYYDRFVGIDNYKNIEYPDLFLMQNYPNPFNPSTVISYSISKDCRVNLKVNDMLGREIKTLVNQYQSAGKYSITFNGSSLTGGVYYYRIDAGGFTTIKRMILTK
jgi:hypothetical protein